MRSCGATFGVLLLSAACATRPVDPFVQAERSLHRQDLAGALRDLDAVPVAHARYPEARAAALEVERNMRRCHELMLEAMLLRSEWRDGEAIKALQQVQAIWPGMPGVDVLVAATEQRRRLFGEPAAGGLATDEPAPPPAPLPAPIPTPLPAPLAEPSRVPAATTAAPEAGSPVAPAGATAAAPAREGEVPPVESSVALGLIAVEARLGSGQLEAAVIDLIELARRFPGDVRVRMRLVRMLHQRALLRYGDGAVAMAIADWRRVLELDPQHAAARRLLEAAELEGR